MGILNKKTSNKKEEVKTAQAYNCEEFTVYEGYVGCPYCKDIIQICGTEITPIKATCASCNKQFNIIWE